jgi:hypothetical protein
MRCFASICPYFADLWLWMNVLNMEMGHGVSCELISFKIFELNFGILHHTRSIKTFLSSCNFSDFVQQ